MSDAFVLHEPLPELTGSTMVVMLEGWIDASASAAAAIGALRQQCASTPLATFAGDEFIDYRARRPVLSLRDGVVTDLHWPTIELAVGRDRVGNDIVTLSGPEPDSQWQRFVAEAVGLAEQLNVTTMVGLGAYPFATPHTRDSRLSVTSPNAEYVSTLTYLKNSLDVPAGMGAALEMSADRKGIRAFGLWAQVPHYISSPGYPAASVALLHGLRETTGVDIDLTELAGEADQHRKRLDLLVASNDEHKVMVRQMEELYDAAVQQSPALDSAQIPSGEQLAAEFERFLRDQGRGG
jgi:hypothetical protein